MDRCYHLYVSLPPCSKFWHPLRATVVSVPENESVHLFATEVVFRPLVWVYQARVTIGNNSPTGVKSQT